ncbi:hypothetical protein ASPVEDRAFT_873227 [Aspergillus versicolor CBS 583.65]|uniref:Ubiquitin carboxyl-terminal hydrolase n=1 Tax=Aspergillus versicolor CBS 583.65 TaxID=1036611 RepID=A0A1L9P6F8_ASPVE|nr:uncharacterized protein ASPVEDRAFT_873227 [Aspergillus versicolor CBS 583.65]OJI97105.1 hypothetical protein ASPVEDRAFT_873227 [Aspergillus versicolor CBS 583.65]
MNGANVVWYKQTINNACGLSATLHAACNGDARDSILSNSHLSRLLGVCAPLSQSERARVIEEDVDLDAVYKSVAQQGDSEVPESPEHVVDFHYVYLVKSHTNGQLYELGGDKQEPVDMGALGSDEDVLSVAGLGVFEGLSSGKESELVIISAYSCWHLDNLNFQIKAGAFPGHLYNIYIYILDN